jgi:hypothetical protein
MPGADVAELPSTTAMGAASSIPAICEVSFEERSVTHRTTERGVGMAIKYRLLLPVHAFDDGSAVALDAAAGEVVRLEGGLAQRVFQHSQAADSDVPDEPQGSLMDALLVDLGVLSPVGREVGRRAILTASALGAAASVLSLPSSAAASSDSDPQQATGQLDVSAAPGDGEVVVFYVDSSET